MVTDVPAGSGRFSYAGTRMFRMTDTDKCYYICMTNINTILGGSRRKTLLEKLAAAHNPEKIFFVIFLIVILLGSIILSLPVSNAAKPAPYIDNLFTACSAVCVTGLSTVTAASQYSIFGRIIMIFLMQTGGLGPMTIIAIIYQRNRKRMATTEKKLFAAGSGKSGLYDVPAYIRRIIQFTIIFELIGFILLAVRLAAVYGAGTGIFNALFLSVSAFTNAGFDTIGSASLTGFAHDPMINFTVMLLIITGGLGFVVWFELYDLLKSSFRKTDVLTRKRKKLSVHAVVVLRATLFLLVSGTVLFFLMEVSNPGTIRNEDGAVRLLVSLFQSVTLRTAGFATVNIGSCTRPMLLIMCVYMLIGGSPGGTAGGMKTTTAAVLFRSAANTLDNRHEDAVIRYRRVSPKLLKQAFVILFLYVVMLFLAVVLLTIAEPAIELLPLLFEAVSAIATVGISTGITSSLNIAGKIIIMVLMFIGRLGPLSIYLAFHNTQNSNNHVAYPDAAVIIG